MYHFIFLKNLVDRVHLFLIYQNLHNLTKASKQAYAKFNANIVDLHQIVRMYRLTLINTVHKSQRVPVSIDGHM